MEAVTLHEWINEIIVVTLRKGWQILELILDVSDISL